jgi:hypothetical protein
VTFVSRDQIDDFIDLMRENFDGADRTDCVGLGDVQHGPWRGGACRQDAYRLRKAG